MPTPTPNFGFTKPDIGDTSLWGTETNSNWDLLDGVIRLDKILDPTADKTFVMGTNILSFNGAVVIGTYDPAVQTFVPSNVPNGHSYSPLVSQVKVTDLGGNGSPAGASISAYDIHSSGLLGSVSALELDAVKDGAGDVAAMAGIGCFVWNRGGGTIGDIFGISVGIENDAGHVPGQVNVIYVQGADNGGTVDGDWVGINIRDQSFGSTNGRSIGLLLANQGTGASDWAIKTGLGKVEFGDVVQFDNGISGRGIVQSRQVTVTSAQLKTLVATPVVIVTAPGAGKYVLVHNVSLQYKFGTVPYTLPLTPGDLDLVVGTGAFRLSWHTPGFLNKSENQLWPSILFTSGSGGGESDQSQLENLQLLLSINATASGELTVGDGTLVVTVYYSLEDLS